MKIKKPAAGKPKSSLVATRPPTEPKPLALQTAWRATKQTLAGSGSKWVTGIATLLVATSVSVSVVSDAQDKAAPDKTTTKTAAPTPKPALTVTTVLAERRAWNETYSASGNVAAWQEALVASELNGYRITSVLANVGDVVKKGQVLATLSSETIEADAAQSRACCGPRSTVPKPARRRMLAGGQKSTPARPAIP